MKHCFVVNPPVFALCSKVFDAEPDRLSSNRKSIFARQNIILPRCPTFSTLTFAIVFFPVVFLSGLAKFLFTPLAVAASIAIFASYVLAITLVPAYCARFLTIRKANDTILETSPQSGVFARTYQAILRQLLRLRYPVVLLAAGAFVLAWLLMNRHLGQELFPKVDSGQVSIFIRMPTGTRIEETEGQASCEM